MDVRKVFMTYVRPYLDTRQKKEAARNATELEIGTLDGMIYYGRGGIEAWQSLLTYVFDISDKQLQAVLTEIKEVLRKRIKLTPGQMLWSQVGDELSEDEKIFFAELALAHKRLKPPFEVKQKKK
jgi:hypothetical protein